MPAITKAPNSASTQNNEFNQQSLSMTIIISPPQSESLFNNEPTTVYVFNN